MPHRQGQGVLRLLLTVVALLTLAACGAPPRGEPVTLLFKHARILGPADPLPRLLREFESRHPGVRVKSEALPWNTDEQHQFYVVNLEGGSPAFDVMMLDVIWVPEFARAGWLLDLSALVPQTELVAHFPAAIAPARWGGRVWALPWIMNVGVLYYRADLLTRYGLGPPETWDELVAQVRRIQASEGSARLGGFLWQGKQYEGLIVNLLEGLWANGTELIGEDGTIFPDAARAEQVLAFLRMLIDSGVSPAWVTAGDEELTRRAFGDGRAIFLRNWPYAMDLFQLPDSPVRDKVGIAALPRHAHGTRGRGATGGAHLAVDRRTRHPDEAASLVSFLTGPEAQKAMAAGVALNPTRIALYDDPNLIRGHPQLPMIRALTAAGRPRPVTPFYLMLSSTLQPEVSAVLVKVKTPREAIRDARRSLGYLLRELQ